MGKLLALLATERLNEQMRSTRGFMSFSHSALVLINETFIPTFLPSKN